MVCRVCPDRVTCREERDCQAAPQRVAHSMIAFFSGRCVSQRGPGTNPMNVVNHAAEDAAPNTGAPRE